MSYLTVAYVITLILLLPYGCLCIILTYGVTKKKSHTEGSNTTYPLVTIQLPIYNEHNTLQRLLKSVSGLSWPRSKLEILVLDDSKDETSILVENEIGVYSSLGLDIRSIRRADRAGFKAGALQNALRHSNGEYIAIFDADNTPPTDFLEATIPILESNPELGFIQTRLDFHNRSYSNLTEAFAIAFDNHYQLEQQARQNLSLVSTFNGSAGVIRKEALLDIGGWRSYTLTEDVDLSARMAVNGWKSRYMNEVVVGSDLPYNLTDFLNQQSRWATGGIQATPILIKPIWRSKHLTTTQKIEAMIHLTNYLVFPVMVVSFILSVSLIVLGFDLKPIFYSATGMVALLGSLGASMMYLSSLLITGEGVLGKIPHLLLLVMTGIGISPRLSIDALRNYVLKKNDFVITPKYDVDQNPHDNDVVVKNNIKRNLHIEVIFIVITLTGIIYSIINKMNLILASLIIQLMSYLITSYYLRKR